ncbi:hypothetical protein [Paracidovorax wautersii]|uniref:hypothetical protein n=1 Tax=Paracidovorax wautersii TaxID=1177982 RepID=UPI0031E36907
MKAIASAIRRFAVWQFKWQERASILDINGQEFERVLRSLENSGWRQTYRYWGTDAGIDYDCIKLKRNGIRLKCEWDNFDEWSIEGPNKAVQALASELNLHAVAEWRWARWTQNPVKTQ